MTEQEYNAEVRSIAEDLAKRANAGEFGTGEDAREAFSECLWETIDGHEYVIYTHKSQLVLAHSRNDAYALEEWGIESAVKDGAIDWAGLAFGALYADVQEVLFRVEGFDLNDPCPE